jgi:hypothetical protein
MRPADLHTGCAQIRDAYKELQAAWLEVSQQWNDGVSRTFCEQRLEPMGPTVKLALESLSRMMHLADQVRQDCER